MFVGRFLELPQGKQEISDEEHEEIPWSSDRLFEKNQKVFEWPLNSLGNPSTDHRADKMVQIWTDFQCWSFSSVTTNKHCRCFITLIYHNGNIMLKQSISISFCLDWGSCFCSTLLYYQAIKKSLKQPYFILIRTSFIYFLAIYSWFFKIFKPIKPCQFHDKPCTYMCREKFTGGF